MRYVKVAEPVYTIMARSHAQMIFEAAENDTSYLDKVEETALGLLLIGFLSKIVDSAKTLVRTLPTNHLTSLSLNDRLHQVSQAHLMDIAIDVDGYIEQAFKVGKADGFKKLSREAFQGIADNHALSFLSNHSFDQITNLSNDLREKIRGEIWKGVKNGNSVEVVAKRLTKIIKEPLEIVSKNTGQVIRTMSPEHRAKLIARTELHRANMQGRLLAFENYGVELVSIVNHGANICSRCKKIAQNSPYKIKDLIRLPVHPNCKCTYENYSNPKESPRDNNSYYNLVTGTVMNIPKI